MSQHTESLASSAGFFNGEGCTVFRNKRPPRRDGTCYAYPAIYVGQADREPLDWLTQALGVGKVLGPFRPYARSKKLHWKFEIYGFEKVQAAIALMWPWLTTVKRQQATKVLLAVRRGYR